MEINSLKLSAEKTHQATTHAIADLGLVWVSRDRRGIGPKTRHARNQTHAWESSPSRPKTAFGYTGFAFWPTPIPWKTREFSTAPPHAALLFHASSSRSSLFRATVRRLSRAAASPAPPPASPATPEGETAPYPPPSLHLLHHLIHSPLFFTARVCQAPATAAAAAATDPRFGSSR
jgi:hypothetical protein